MVNLRLKIINRIQGKIVNHYSPATPLRFQQFVQRCCRRLKVLWACGQLREHGLAAKGNQRS